MIINYIVGGLVGLYLFSGFRVVRPVELGLVETFGRYTKTASAGLHWIALGVQDMRRINVTEQMVDVEPQTVITKDNLNAVVNAVVYYKVADVKKSEYNVDNHAEQLTSLTKTTLRAVIGKMSFTEANEDRNAINTSVASILDNETKNYGVGILRVEIEKIEAPADVQDAMNEVVKAERNKLAAKDFANAEEIKAEGLKRAAVQEAEGLKEASILKADGDRQASIMRAEGKAKAFDLIEKAFKGNAQTLKRLEVTQASLENNSKIILSEKGISPQLIIGDIPTTVAKGKGK